MHLTDTTSDLFRRCLDPYRGTDTIYLRAAEVDSPAADPVAGVDPAAGPAGLVTRGEFGIPRSCYIDDTGHFNAAEFIISYNQIMYLSLAAAIAAGDHPVLRGWTLEDYWARQLPNVLIQRCETTYSRPIDARGFSGTFRLTALDASRLDRGIVKLATEMSFADDSGGRARGSVLLALTDAPPAGLAAVGAIAAEARP